MALLSYVTAVILSLAAASADAASVRLPVSAGQAEDRIRSWLQTDGAIRERLSDTEAAAEQAAPKGAAAADILVEPDLKDALAEVPAQPDPARERQELLKHLPGIKNPDFLGCTDFKSCNTPALALDVAPGEPLEPAVRALLRPWLWLQEARGQRLAVSVPGPDTETTALSRALRMDIKDPALSDIGLNMSVRGDGRVHIWFDRGLELAELYSRLRESLISQ